MLDIINTIINIYNFIIKPYKFIKRKKMLIIFSILLIVYILYSIPIYESKQYKIDTEEIVHKHKEIEKNNSEETKYKVILDNNLASITYKFIEEGHPDIAKEIFIYERDKMREQELEMQKIKNEHELNMEDIKNPNFWETFK